MARPRLPDGLWAVIAPLLPPANARSRAALPGILFVLRWGLTCWRRLQDCQKAGVRDRLQHAWLDRLGGQNGIDVGRTCPDSAAIAARTGRGDRPEPERSRQAGRDVPRPHRCERHPPRAEAGGRERA
jgi:transposase